MFTHAMFDLDGTLLFTLEDLADSGNAALEELGFPIHPVEAYRYFVGDGIDELMRRLLPPEESSNHDMGVLLREKYVQQYNRRWSVKTRPYNGIAEMLQGLKSKGLTLSVFSNKPDDFTHNCINHFFPEGTFAAIRGGRPETPRKPSPAGALAILEQLKIAPEQVIYVGDTSTDMQTAHAGHFFAVGVTWGFRDRQELEANKADAVIDKPQELLSYIS